MVNKPTNKITRDELMEIRGTIEKLSAENQFLRQRTELEHDWREERYKQSQEFAQHKRDVEREIKNRLGGLSVVGLIVIGLGWWSITRPIRHSVQVRLDKEFASKNIKTLISNAALRAAQSKTKQMMETTLKPAVTRAMAEIQQQRNIVMQFTEEFRKDSSRNILKIQNEIREEHQEQKRSLDNLRKQYTVEIGQLQPLVDFQGKLKDIEILKDNAIRGDFDAYQKLTSYKSSDKDLAAADQTAIIEVKEPYLVGNRTAGISIWLLNRDGTKGLSDGKIPSAGLISVFLLSNKPWQMRAKAAQLLGSRRDVGVAEALLTAMQHDRNLWVRRAALLSFQTLTGFRPNDAFDFEGAATWWKKNKSNYLKNILK